MKSGQEVRFSLVPAPSDTGAMEPIKVSIYAKGGEHLATVQRNRQGDFVATTDGDQLKTRQTVTRATLYQSFYHAALNQHIPAETILKILRVQSYDVDFKQKVKPGDTFEAFFDADNDAEAVELLYTSMTIDGAQRKFYRFRTPDDVVDYYDEQGNSAKKFLMRNPVKGGRYTSGFGERRGPFRKRSDGLDSSECALDSRPRLSGRAQLDHCALLQARVRQHFQKLFLRAHVNGLRHDLPVTIVDEGLGNSLNLK